MKQVMLAMLMAAAASAPVEAQLPDAKVLVKAYSTAIGAPAMLKYTSIHSAGSFAMPAAGLSGTIDISRAQPNRVFMKVGLPGVGELLRGFDGNVGWTSNPMEGSRVLSGAEGEQMKEESEIVGTVRELSYFSALETVEKTTMDGQECYKVKLTWKSGRTTHDCYAVNGGLLIATLTSQPTPAGVIEVTTLMGDYKKFGDILLPTRLRQTVMGQEQQVTIDTVVFDQVADTVFVLPDAIKALVNTKKQES